MAHLFHLIAVINDRQRLEEQTLGVRPSRKDNDKAPEEDIGARRNNCGLRHTLAP